jgi:hypothetical protein
MVLFYLTGMVRQAIVVRCIQTAKRRKDENVNEKIKLLKYWWQL